MIKAILTSLTACLIRRNKIEKEKSKFPGSAMFATYNLGAFACDVADSENGLLTANQTAAKETLIYVTNHENKLKTVASAAAGDARRHLTERQLVHNFMGLPSSHPHKRD